MACAGSAWAGGVVSRGRPTDCTPETTAIIVAALERGLSITSACAAADIVPSTYHHWQSRAGDGPPYSDFKEATTRARSKGVSSLEEVVLKATETDWRAAAWALERRAPNEFSKRTEVSGPEGAPIAVVGIDPRGMTDEQIAETLKRLGVGSA